MSSQGQLFEAVPEGMERFQEIVSEAIPNWKPDRSVWDRVAMLQKQGSLDLEAQALDMVIWFRANKKRKGTNAFVVNWLKRAIEFKEQNGKRAAQTYWQQRDGGSYLEPLTGDDLKRRGNSI